MPKVFEVYKVPIIIGAGSLLTILLAVFLLFQSVKPATPIIFSDDTVASASAGASPDIHIDIEGAVQKPGLYKLAAGSRVEDAIVAAGGLTRNADSDQLAKTVNRAMKLVDGGKIYVPSVSSPSKNVLGDTGNATSINTGTEAELDKLPGVGAVIAQKIIAGRPYQTLEELVTKKAVGQALFEKLKDQLSL